MSETRHVAQKCTFCYDRLKHHLAPACAQACPTQSIRFGPLTQMKKEAQARVAQLQRQGQAQARLYGADDKVLGGLNSFYLLLDEPEVYGLPPDPVVTTRDLPAMWRRAAVAALGVAAGIAVSFVGRG
jgi:formate dehydrogenase iron-sulfur subunit